MPAPVKRLRLLQRLRPLPLRTLPLLQHLRQLQKRSQLNAHGLRRMRKMMSSSCRLYCLVSRQNLVSAKICLRYSRLSRLRHRNQ